MRIANRCEKNLQIKTDNFIYLQKKSIFSSIFSSPLIPFSVVSQGGAHHRNQKDNQRIFNFPITSLPFRLIKTINFISSVFRKWKNPSKRDDFSSFPLSRHCCVFFVGRFSIFPFFHSLLALFLTHSLTHIFFHNNIANHLIVILIFLCDLTAKSWIKHFA